jgi:NADH-quinone oxidoreductase subunit A
VLTLLVRAGRKAKFVITSFFDVEAVFIFPWATQLERYGMFGLVEMGIFVFVLLLGLVYAWRKGVLRWV